MRAILVNANIMSLSSISKDLQMTHVYWAVVLMTTVLLLGRILQYGMRTKDLPPGPPTTPLIGNLLQMPTKNFHTGLQKLTQQCKCEHTGFLSTELDVRSTHLARINRLPADGPIVTMKLGSQNLFLLNDPTVVRDLIEKRQSNYSCRPDFYMRSFGDNLNIAMREYDGPPPRAFPSSLCDDSLVLHVFCFDWLMTVFREQ